MGKALTDAVLGWDEGEPHGNLRTAVWKPWGGQELPDGRCSCQALGSARSSPQTQSKASSQGRAPAFSRYVLNV
jgi:hypothetical protein